MTAPASPSAPEPVVLDGFHALKHALRFGATVERAATSDPDGLDALAAELAPDLRTRLRELVEVVDAAELRTLAPQLPHTRVVALARRPPLDPVALLAPPRDGDPRPLVLLEDPRHLGNVGAVVRVAAAADAAGVLTTGARDPWDRAAVRGAAGLHFALPVGRVELEDVVGAAAAGALAGGSTPGGGVAPGRPLVALDPAGEPLRAAAGQLPPGAILAFGTERHGLSDALLTCAELRLRIEMRAGVSSLNLATAVSAVLFST
ncbi:TrmH family RNA methyltransferase [Conexibacter woesei]|uniref:tRNA/rRNA methyltransferase (SpoU) n=1 Tax=Conexibacter woesei (strain DSM 14684 / CCUG 47730 / CIP 108061 / JCM 11494 / NBRC 100937 / ID131577) TaxID=469383 RepID=D3FBZ9_CONWI|nr:TrmH family RNA methyltransferase [Conexibacter woesei]ADB51414.1 tRNA/rRNA methyltransferase (SpoU) [Conexibacter woesei DSM 14684]